MYYHWDSELYRLLIYEEEYASNIQSFRIFSSKIYHLKHHYKNIYIHISFSSLYIIWKSLALSFDQKRLVVLRHFYIHLRFITYNVYTCPRQWAIKTAHKSVVYVQIIHLYSDVSSLTVANVCFFGLSVCDMSESTVILPK